MRRATASALRLGALLALLAGGVRASCRRSDCQSTCTSANGASSGTCQLGRCLCHAGDSALVLPPATQVPDDGGARGTPGAASTPATSDAFGGVGWTSQADTATAYSGAPRHRHEQHEHERHRRRTRTHVHMGPAGPATEPYSVDGRRRFEGAWGSRSDIAEASGAGQRAEGSQADTRAERRADDGDRVHGVPKAKRRVKKRRPKKDGKGAESGEKDKSDEEGGKGKGKHSKESGGGKSEEEENGGEGGAGDNGAEYVGHVEHFEHVEHTEHREHSTEVKREKEEGEAAGEEDGHGHRDEEVIERKGADEDKNSDDNPVASAGDKQGKDGKLDKQDEKDDQTEGVVKIDKEEDGKDEVDCGEKEDNDREKECDDGADDADQGDGLARNGGVNKNGDEEDDDEESDESECEDESDEGSAKEDEIGSTTATPAAE